MPFVRYLNGDRAIAAPRHAPADGDSRPSPGDRAKLDILPTPDGRHVPGEFFPHLLKEFDEVRRFQVVQESLSHVTLKVVLSAGKPARLHQIERQAAAVLGPMVRFSIEPVADIPLTGAGKLQVVVSQLVELPSPPRPELRHSCICSSSATPFPRLSSTQGGCSITAMVGRPPARRSQRRCLRSCAPDGQLAFPSSVSLLGAGRDARVSYPAFFQTSSALASPTTPITSSGRPCVALSAASCGSGDPMRSWPIGPIPMGRLRCARGAEVGVPTLLIVGGSDIPAAHGRAVLLRGHPGRSPRCRRRPCRGRSLV